MAETNPFPCRSGCGACCIAPSLSSPIPGMPGGKKAGEACIHLTGDFHCLLYDKKERPAVCGSLKPCPEMCGPSREYALAYLGMLERETAPS